MGKHRNATKVGGGAHKDVSPAPSYHGVKPCDTAQHLTEEVASQTYMSLKMPFRFTQSSRLPFIHPLSLEPCLVHSTTPNDWMHYCIHIRVTLKVGKGE